MLDRLEQGFTELGDRRMERLSQTPPRWARLLPDVFKHPTQSSDRYLLRCFVLFFYLMISLVQPQFLFSHHRFLIHARLERAATIALLEGHRLLAKTEHCGAIIALLVPFIVVPFLALLTVSMLAGNLDDGVLEPAGSSATREFFVADDANLKRLASAAGDLGDSDA